MIQSAETTLDGTTLVVRILMRFSGAEAGASASSPLQAAKSPPTSKPPPDGTLVKALAQGLAVAADAR